MYHASTKQWSKEEQDVFQLALIPVAMVGS